MDEIKILNDALKLIKNTFETCTNEPTFCAIANPLKEAHRFDDLIQEIHDECDNFLSRQDVKQFLESL